MTDSHGFQGATSSDGGETDPARSQPNRPPVVQIDHLSHHFSLPAGLLSRRHTIRAVEDVSFSIAPGETLGLVGESGSGKSTLARTILRLLKPTEGRIYLQGRDVTSLSQRRLRGLRRRMQIIFQDPQSSLDPRMTVHEIIAEPLQIHQVTEGGLSEAAAVRLLLERVGLDANVARRYPHEFSGGQRQRIGIARALAVEPAFIVCDEPLSALDVSIQAQIVNLLLDLRESRGVSYLFISHDLEVVRYLSHRIAVMYLGRLIELGPARRLTSSPLHPYTHALLSACPVPNPDQRRPRLVLQGDVPSPLHPPQGCGFHPRCSRRVSGICDREVPLAREVTPASGHCVACHFPIGSST